MTIYLLGRSAQECQLVFDDIRRNYAHQVQSRPSHPPGTAGPSTYRPALHAGYPQHRPSSFTSAEAVHSLAPAPPHLTTTGRSIQPRPPSVYSSPAGGPPIQFAGAKAGTTPYVHSSPTAAAAAAEVHHHHHHPPAKKRGRPSNAEIEQRKLEYEARGETYPTPRAPKRSKGGIQSSSQASTSPQASKTSQPGGGPGTEYEGHGERSQGSGSGDSPVKRELEHSEQSAVEPRSRPSEGAQFSTSGGTGVSSPSQSRTPLSASTRGPSPPPARQVLKPSELVSAPSTSDYHPRYGAGSSSSRFDRPSPPMSGIPYQSEREREQQRPSSSSSSSYPSQPVLLPHPMAQTSYTHPHPRPQSRPGSGDGNERGYEERHSGDGVRRESGVGRTSA